MAVPGVGGHRVEFLCASLRGLIDMPAWAQDLSVLGHVADPWGTTHWLPLAIQLGVGIACCAGGLIAYRVRDIPA